MTLGKTAAGIGCGPIGLFAIRRLLTMAASEAIAVDVSGQKLELARQAGATRAARPVCFIGIPVPDVVPDTKRFQHFPRRQIALHGSCNSFGARVGAHNGQRHLPSRALGR